jgi:hypothetical protein
VRKEFAWNFENFLHARTYFLVFAAAIAAGEPNCVKLAEENPLKINRYYNAHENDCNKYYQVIVLFRIFKHCQ